MNDEIPPFIACHSKIRPIAKEIADKSYFVVKSIDEGRLANQNSNQQALLFYQWLLKVESEILGARHALEKFVSLEECKTESSNLIEKYIHGVVNDNSVTKIEDEPANQRFNDIEEDPF